MTYPCRRRSPRRAGGASAVLLIVLVTFAATFINTSPASAHDATSDAVTLVVNDRRIAATATVPYAELGFVDTTGDGLFGADELAAQEAGLATTLVATVRDHVHLTIDGDESPIIAAGVPSISPEDGGSASAFVTLIFASGPHDGDVGNVELDWTFDSPGSSVVLSHPDGVTTGNLGDNGTVDFSLGAWSSAASFFALGIEHIRFGPDHLLFLLVLTLTVAGSSVTSSSVWRTVKLVTAFTIGHAVSLCLAYFDLVSVPAAVVEPAISLSIVAAAVLAIRGRATDARPWIATVIGVIHGLGFASSLASIGIATTQQLPALAAFNLGIDLAQTAVVLVVLGGLWMAGKALDNRIAWVTIPAAAFAGLAGLAWTASRLGGLQL